MEMDGYDRSLHAPKWSSKMTLINGNDDMIPIFHREDDGGIGPLWFDAGNLKKL